VTHEIKSLIEKSQTLTVCCIHYDINEYQDKIAIRSFILQQKPASEDQNLFEQELDDQLSKWQSTQTSIHCLQANHFELNQ
jgi:hypothetical protein